MNLKFIFLIILFFNSMAVYGISIYEKNLYLGIKKSSPNGARYFTKTIANLRSNNMKAVIVYKTKLCKRVKKSRSVKRACLYLSREISKKVKSGKILKKRVDEKKIIKKSDKVIDKELSKPEKVIKEVVIKKVEGKEEVKIVILEKEEKKYRVFKKETVEGEARIVEECKRYFCFKTKYIRDKKVSYKVYNNTNLEE